MINKIREGIALPFVALAVALLYSGCWIAHGTEGIQRVQRILR